MEEIIIIDGVNVTGCKYYSQVEYIQNCNGYDETPDSCSAYPDRICVNRINCYFKQLKRLEQENARLKEKIIKLSEEKGHLVVKNNTLEEANQSLSVLGADLASANEIVRKEFFRADKNKDMWREKAENLQKTLQEIKKYIAKICKEECGYVQKKRCPDCDCRFGAILDLITKAEEE